MGYAHEIMMLEGDVQNDFICKYCGEEDLSDRGLTAHVAYDCDEAPEASKEDAHRRLESMRMF